MATNQPTRRKSQFQDLTGETFCKLTVLRRAERHDHGWAFWECRCECGNTRVIPTHKLKGGATVSCGCYSKASKNIWQWIERKSPEECWPWTGKTRTHFGYGKIVVKGKQTSAHRIAYEAVNGPIPEGLFVCHRCDNPICCNPSHLFLGTCSDNQKDMVSKGRSMRGERHARVRLTEEAVHEIRERKKRGETERSLGQEFGVAKSTIHAITSGKIWGWLQQRKETDHDEETTTDQDGPPSVPLSPGRVAE